MAELFDQIVQIVLAYPSSVRQTEASKQDSFIQVRPSIEDVCNQLAVQVNVLFVERNEVRLQEQENLVANHIRVSILKHFLKFLSVKL